MSPIEQNRHMQTTESMCNAPVTPVAADRRALLAGIGGLAAGALLAGAKTAHAGPLTPPPGPVTSTPGPEPRIPINSTNTPGTATAVFQITQPGSYYLERNLAGESGKHGIDIAASNVTIDLNGFDLAGGTGSLDGVRSAVANLRAIAILNGSLRNWGGSGINLFGNFVVAARIEGVHIHSCGSAGFSIGSSSIIANCTTSNNASDGYFVANNCTITNCAANFNLTGFSIGRSCTVSGCSASSNTNDGFNTNNFCVLSNCTASGNTRNGFLISTGTLITDSSATGNLTSGIICSGNSCAITKCLAAFNSSHGIVLSTASVAAANHSSSNGSGTTGTGIRATGTDNRIEDNLCVSNRIGIECLGSGNFIVRNTCSDNSVVNWSLAANNAHGAIVDRSSPGSSSVSGNSASSSLVSTDPHANFTI